MSDFLSRLAGRALGVEPVVQPVIPVAMAAAVPREETFGESEGFGEVVQQGAVVAQSAARPGSAGVDRLEPPVLRDRVAEREAASGSDVQVIRAGDRRVSELGGAEAFGGEVMEADRRDATIPLGGGLYSQPSEVAVVPMLSERREWRSSVAPVVRVSIGRIDVRAEMSSSPKDRVSAVPRAKSDSISLDDYLKQRTEGRR